MALDLTFWCFLSGDYKKVGSNTHISREKKINNEKQTALTCFSLSISVTQLVLWLLLVGDRELARLHSLCDSLPFVW